MSNVRSSSNWITRLPLILVVALMLTALLVACGDKDEPAPTEIVVVTGQLSATASPTSAPPINETETIAAILESSNATATAQQQIIDAQATQLTLATTQQAGGGQQGSEPTLDPAIAATQTYQASLPSPTPTATATDLPSIFPTPQIEQAIVVEQVFEGHDDLSVPRGGPAGRARRGRRQRRAGHRRDDEAVGELEIPQPPRREQMRVARDAGACERCGHRRPHFGGTIGSSR